jgi:hypothetical protein
MKLHLAGKCATEQVDPAWAYVLNEPTPAAPPNAWSNHVPSDGTSEVSFVVPFWRAFVPERVRKHSACYNTYHRCCSNERALREGRSYDSREPSTEPVLYTSNVSHDVRCVR